MPNYSDLWFTPIQENFADLWFKLGTCALSWALQVLPDEKKALALQEQAIYCFKKAGPSKQEEVWEVLVIYFKTIVTKYKLVEFGDKALKAIEAEDPDWAELLRPFRAFFDYMKTKDKSILMRLWPELRYIVEEMIAIVEGKEAVNTDN
jgi:hypothetical protein